MQEADPFRKTHEEVLTDTENEALCRDLTRSAGGIAVEAEMDSAARQPKDSDLDLYVRYRHSDEILCSD